MTNETTHEYLVRIGAKKAVSHEQASTPTATTNRGIRIMVSDDGWL